MEMEMEMGFSWYFGEGGREARLRLAREVLLTRRTTTRRSSSQLKLDASLTLHTWFYALCAGLLRCRCGGLLV